MTKKTLKVFVVDDSAIVRERLTTMLSEIEGVEIIGRAEDALEATGLIRKLRPDAVILDIRLPNGSGINVLKTIKREQPALVAIMLTLYPYAQYRQSCMKAGANFFFDKSTGFEKIPAVLKQLIHKSTLELAK